MCLMTIVFDLGDAVVVIKSQLLGALPRAVLPPILVFVVPKKNRLVALSSSVIKCLLFPLGLLDLLL